MRKWLFPAPDSSYRQGLWHIFATASPQGNPHPDKTVEQIGWAISSDGIHFTVSLLHG